MSQDPETALPPYFSISPDAALAELDDPRAKLLINERSGRAAVQIPTTSVMLDDGEIERRVRLIRPMEAHNIPIRMMGETHWVEADRDAFASAWEAEIARMSATSARVRNCGSAMVIS